MAFYNRRKLELQEAQKKYEAAERHVRELEADWQAIEAVIAMLVMSQDGIIERVNPAFLDLLRFEQHELIGKHHRVICDNEYARSESYIRFWRELVTGNVESGSFPVIDANGQRLVMHARYSPVKGEQGVTRRVIALVSGVQGEDVDYGEMRAG